MDSNVKVTQLPSIKTHCFITDFSIFLNFFLPPVRLQTAAYNRVDTCAIFSPQSLKPTV